MQYPGKADLIQVAEQIRAFIHKTPVLTSETFNRLFEAELFFKCENFQKAGAFKSRGAVNAVLSLSGDEAENGVATHSSGNHAQALARAASIRGIPAYIVMPSNSSQVKIDAVKQYGGIITFCKPTLKDREDTLQQVMARTKAIEIHPYDNFDVIAGQATVAKELFEEVNGLDILLCPVGGGGLLSGTALAAAFFADATDVIACEPSGADDAMRSFREGRIIPSVNPQTIADGLLTSLGERNFPIIQQYVKDVVTVSETSIVKAMRLLFERMKIVVEPSAAVPLAALLEQKIIVKHQKVGIILSGGNIDLKKLPF